MNYTNPIIYLPTETHGKASISVPLPLFVFGISLLLAMKQNSKGYKFVIIIISPKK
jgi:hypothetical protein